jgi:hypothetical protein
MKRERDRNRGAGGGLGKWKDRGFDLAMESGGMALEGRILIRPCFARGDSFWNFVCEGNPKFCFCFVSWILLWAVHWRLIMGLANRVYVPFFGLHSNWTVRCFIPSMQSNTSKINAKAAGPDGMPAIFFKKFWETIGAKVKNEVMAPPQKNEVMAVLNGGNFPNGWNDTTIVLIPKVKNPNHLKDLRPISLCNVLYKIISKVLTNRLKGCWIGYLCKSKCLCTGRLITDNVLVAYEMTHFLSNKRQGNDGYMTLKLDMSKGYDRVEWDFVEAMLCKLGFAQRYIQLLINCVRTAKYCIKVNEYTEEIIP